MTIDPEKIIQKHIDECTRKYAETVEGFCRYVGITEENVHEYEFRRYVDHPITWYCEIVYYRNNNRHKLNAKVVGVIAASFEKGSNGDYEFKVECLPIGITNRKDNLS